MLEPAAGEPGAAQPGHQIGLYVGRADFVPEVVLGVRDCSLFLALLRLTVAFELTGAPLRGAFQWLGIRVGLGTLDDGPNTTSLSAFLLTSGTVPVPFFSFMAC